VSLRLPADVVELLRCPACSSAVIVGETEIACSNSSCSRRYPIVEGIPILLDEQKSLFSIEDVAGKKAFLPPPGGLRERILQALPTVSKNINASRNYRRFASLLGSSNPPPKVLVIGGATEGAGMHSLPLRAFTLIETDIYLGPQTSIACDGHDIPFRDNTFDGCIIQAVLQHVVDPFRCIAEVHRVLKPGGLVYAETAFMQQVHGEAFDFIRFSHRGQRRLFRYFEEVDSGATCGPAMALAWSYQYFLLSWARSRAMRGCALVFARLTSFWLKYLDIVLINRRSSLYAASAFYFLGRKTAQPLSDKDLVFTYRSAERD